MIKKYHHDFLKSNIPTIFENKRKKQTSQEISQKKTIREKIKDLKDLSRRPNVQIMGIPEGEIRTDGRLLIIK